IDVQGIVFGYAAEYIDVPADEIRLADNADLQTAVQREFLQDAARDLEALLRRLIRIGRRTDRDFLALLHLLQLLPENPRRLLLDVDLAFEIHTVIELHELMRVARVAILTGELAAAIRVD